MGEVILTMKGIDKSFPGVHALDHVDLEVRLEVNQEANHNYCFLEVSQLVID